MIHEPTDAAPPSAVAVLVSGGLDSAVLLVDQALRAPVQPVYIKAGLAWEPVEREYLDRFLERERGRLSEVGLQNRLSMVAVLEVPMRQVYGMGHWAIRGTPPSYNTRDDEVYLAGRNVILLAQAGVFCGARGISRVAIGTLAGNPFPDATAEFFEAMGRTLSVGLGQSVRIEAPYRALHKTDIIRRGAELGVALELTLSCMNPEHGLHCGACSKCRERHESFLEAGLKDPTVYLGVRS
ncbi:MAG: 7-cyano-7-deazaguanine synthase [Acidimicrobiia bacterium]